MLKFYVAYDKDGKPAIKFFSTKAEAFAFQKALKADGVTATVHPSPKSSK